MNIKAQLEKIREIEEQRYNIDPLYYDRPESEPVIEAIKDVLFEEDLKIEIARIHYESTSEK